MRGKVAEIRGLGAELVVVGNGRPDQAADFRRQENLDFPLLVDPEMSAYRAAGLKRGITDALSLGTLRHAVRAYRQGFRQSSVQGDPWQLGGTMVITPENKVLFRHVNRDAGDHPDPKDILDVLKGSARSS